ncbi:PKD domain-containing protein, partial [Candidatus Kaiserbacteria bacterium]|nr:PKD domain-containing protein [Candidatus Kaiserbacteria bacterium]
MFWFAHADSPPTLTTYTVSYGTIYPTATAESGLATTTAIDIAFSEHVKASIKILSASGTLIKSLYTSSGVTNPTPKIWDGTNNASTLVGNGTYTILISATSTATSLTMTDSSKTVVIASSDSTPPDTSSDTTTETTASSPSGGPPEYIPIPTLRIITGGDKTVSSGADTAFTAVVYDGKGNRRDEALILWSFGDGMQRTGANVYHKYYEPGEYIAVVRVSTPDGGDAFIESIVTVKDASIKIDSVSARGISLTN